MFEPGRITIQYVTTGLIPWCAATIAIVESTGVDDEEKNRLCPPVVFSGDAADLVRFAYSAMQGQVARARDEVVGPRTAASRLNPAQAALDHIDDPDVAESLAFTKEHTQAALTNLERAAAGESRDEDTAQVTSRTLARPTHERRSFRGSPGRRWEGTLGPVTERGAPPLSPWNVREDDRERADLLRVARPGHPGSQLASWRWSIQPANSAWAWSVDRAVLITVVV